MIDAHGGPLVDNSCGVTWGVMAPSDGRPGRLHVCQKTDEHGRHGCACGSTRPVDPGTVVVCCHPIDATNGICGKTVTGVELVDYRGPRRLGHDQMRAQAILSVPCGHPTQRQAS